MARIATNLSLTAISAPHDALEARQPDTPLFGRYLPGETSRIS